MRDTENDAILIFISWIYCKHLVDNIFGLREKNLLLYSINQEETLIKLPAQEDNMCSWIYPIHKTIRKVSNAGDGANTKVKRFFLVGGKKYWTY